MIESLQPASYAIASIFFVLSTATILLRTYTRGFIIKSFGWDDWCMFAILFFNAGQLCILYYLLGNGGGLQIQAAIVGHEKRIINLIYALFVEEIYYTWMHWIIKMAFLLFYLRFANTKRFRMLIYGTMGLNTITAISILILYCSQCIPLDAYFHPVAHPTVKCLDKSIQAFVPAGLNVFIDLLIVVLPIQPLWKIQVSMRKRLMLISIVSLGAVVVLISSLRMIVLNEFRKDTTFTYILGKLIIISSIEIDVAIMAANAPSMKTFWSHYISRSMKDSRSSEYESRNKLSDLEAARRQNAVSQVRCSALGMARDTQSAHESVDELKKNESAIIVISSVGVETSSVESGERSPDAYNKFEKD